MKCPSCAAEMPADAAFCSKCGARLAPEKSGSERLKETALRSANEPDQETVLWRGSYSPKAMVSWWLLLAALAAAGVAAGVLTANPAVWFAALAIVGVWFFVLLLWLAYERLSVEYTLTNQRFIHKTGILSRVTNRVEVIDVDDVSVTQGLIERMLNVGTIKLVSSDVTDPLLLLRGIDRAQDVATLIDNARRDERRKRGLHIETV